jgi:hypothetical protein
MAPGAASARAFAPGHGSVLPAVDDRLIAPESHAQIIDGAVVRTMGANPPHATRHFAVAHVFAGALAPGYEGAVDMLTRTDEDNDLAPDVSIFPEGTDPTTGGRLLEEIAFEVLDTERLAHATGKAEKLIARGVRRVFCVRIADRTVYEWDHTAEGWTSLDPTFEITDRCLRVPIPAGALIDRVLADDVVAQALLASRNRVIEHALAASAARAAAHGRAQGEARGRAAMLLRLCARRGIPVDGGTVARVLACEDNAQLETWFDRATIATREDEIFSGP